MNKVSQVKYHIFLILFLNLILCAVASAGLLNKLKQLQRKYGLTNVEVGIAIQRVKTDKWLFRYHANQGFMPASNNKLLTATAALLLLPTTNRFTTSAFFDKKANNLYIQFTGDPTLDRSELASFVKTIKMHLPSNGQIQGNVIILANRFSAPYYPSGWSESDKQYCYALPISTMNLARNCLALSLMKGRYRPRIIKGVNADFVTVNNQIRYSNQANCQVNFKMNQRNVITLSGCMHKSEQLSLGIPIANPSLNTLNVLKAFFKQEGIRVKGQFQFGNSSDVRLHTLQKIGEISSQTLLPMLKHMLLYSDNFYAESFARTLAYDRDQVGTSKMASKVVVSTLQSMLNVPSKGIQISDGSGLSLKDRVTPTAFVILLTNAYKSPKIGKKLMQLLPSSGVDGTLKYRLGVEPYRNRVHAKTGTQEGAITISGYVYTKRTRLYDFSIMLNHVPKTHRVQARALQDGLIRYIYQNY